MKNYWKQFAEWVTGLKSDVFFVTRFKLTITYVATIVALFFLLDTTLYFTIKYFINLHSPGISEASLAMLLENLNTTFIVLGGGILLISILTGYFLLEIALKPIKRSIEVQKRFIADASHELRTPLSVMKTNTEIALLGSPTAEEASETLKSNLQEIDRMAGIIQNLLSISRIDNKTAELPFAKVNLAEVVLNSVATMRRMASKKNINLILKKADSSFIWGNTTALEEMIINLIKNAITYTPANGSVSISIENRHPMDIQLTVEDTGVGIPAKDIPYIFEPFYKADIKWSWLSRQ